MSDLVWGILIGLIFGGVIVWAIFYENLIHFVKGRIEEDAQTQKEWTKRKNTFIEELKKVTK